jgi:two-component system, LytTR family, sensor kinase
MSGPGAVQPPRPDDEPPHGAAGPAIFLNGAAAALGSGNRGARLIRRVAVAVILLFWLTQFSSLTLMRYVRFPEEGLGNIVPRLIVTCWGIAFALGMLLIQRAARKWSLHARTLMAAGLALLGCVLHSAANWVVFSAFFPAEPFILSDYAMAAIDWMWFYASLSVMILALTYSADLADSEEQIALLRQQADAAQLRALRFQLNPHFLFNTLNSIASLISRRRNEDAEAMVVSLSDFLRSTLKLDPGIEIPLGDEISLQTLYLDIERARFPHRLRVTIDVPENLRDALVPNLITQPLIENAIKYGVARSSKPVHLEVVAAQSAAGLHVEVRDDGGDSPDSAVQGAKVGLTNVSERLRLHFGDTASLSAQPRPEGGFAARIVMPLRKA